MNWRTAGIRGFRLAAVVLAALLIRFGGATPLEVGRGTLTLELAQRAFPGAKRLGAYDEELDAYEVLDAGGEPLGRILRTAPLCDDRIGYAGPSDLLLALDLDGRVQSVELLESDDTRDHVQAMRSSDGFWRSFEGWLPQSDGVPPVDAVSGSTLTSLALIESVAQRLSGSLRSLRFPDPIRLDEVRSLLADAASWGQDPERTAGWFRVFDAQSRPIGWVLRTSPVAERVIGYGGPTESLLAFDRDGTRVTGVRLRASYDTGSYVERVRDDERFLAQLAGRTARQWTELDFAAAGIEGVSGATQTSFAVAESIRQRLQADAPAEPSPTASTSAARNGALSAIVLAAIALTFGPWRGLRWLRRIWQAVLIGGLGLVLGDLLSLALFATGARGQAPWSTAPALLLLVAIALVVPWTTGRQIYCHSLCPHGAAQEWVGSIRRWRLRRLPEGLRRLHGLPLLSLGTGLVLAVFWPQVDLAAVEPFDAWVLGSAAAVSAALALGGLVACLFVPMAYCRFACPTGALLDFVRSGGSADRLGRREFAAAALLAGCGAVCLWSAPTGSAADSRPAAPAAVPALSGQAFGTSWSITVPGPLPATAPSNLTIQREFEKHQQLYSTRGPASEVAQFNSSATTLALECSAPLVAMVEWGLELDERSGGSLGLVTKPGEASQLIVEPQYRTLQKSDPDLHIDVSSLLGGFAVDRVAALLDEAGLSEYRLDLGSLTRVCGGETILLPADLAVVPHTLRLESAALARVTAPAASVFVVATDASTAEGWARTLARHGADAIPLARAQDLCVWISTSTESFRSESFAALCRPGS